ncbi:MAG: UTP--glucose-1-phosphate uridylyltransferase [Desulfobacterota bacterium]|nr:UTP--glucose-1-phosphate uridylyltransferase [Thermodesulfobacteriota bacterium]MDW8001823.1 UTP--glucose-1-phosphate uridylyltransferase [Deltaproteobacteria bacterium]
MEGSGILRLLEKYGQTHIIDHLITLPGKKRELLLENLKRVDFAFINKIYSEEKSKRKEPLSLKDLMPPEVIKRPSKDEERATERRARVLGEELLKQKKVACLLVAGGQATRLGLNSPKGFFSITPVKNKTFFQLFAERIFAISKKYETRIPFLVMTNPESSVEVYRFFEDNKFFGLEKDDLIIFEQDMLPVLTRDGKIVLKNETEVLFSPNGHGNSIKKLCELGIVDTLRDEGFEYLFYFQVDNPLVKIADPVFLGYHRMYGADVSIKVVRRREGEKMGVYLKVAGKPAVIEYSELSPYLSSVRDENGELKFWAGNTAMHVFSIEFIRRIKENLSDLPYHLAEKKVLIDGRYMDVVKFETFVFDSFRWADKVCALEVLREEEFSPVKDKDGPSSPHAARKAMSDLYKKWLQSIGIEVRSDVYVEISPLFALDFEECSEKLKGKHLRIEKDTYIG